MSDLIERLHDIADELSADEYSETAEVIRDAIDEITALRAAHDGDEGGKPMRKRIELTPGYHAEPGETPGHQHDVYTTKGPLGGNKRLHVGTLTKAAVEAWRKAALPRSLNALVSQEEEKGR